MNFSIEVEIACVERKEDYDTDAEGRFVNIILLLDKNGYEE